MSRVTTGASLPFSSGSLRGVGFFAVGEGSIGESMAAELARVLAPAGRIAVWGEGQSEGQNGVQDWEQALKAEGLHVLASEGNAVVVGRTAP